MGKERQDRQFNKLKFTICNVVSSVQPPVVLMSCNTFETTL